MLCASGLIEASDHVVFLHSGGTPGLFAHAASFMKEGAA